MPVTDKTITLNVKSNDEVESLRLGIEGIEGLCPSVQKLVFNGKQLEDGKTLADYEIKNESVIYLYVRLPGGCLVVH